MDRSASEGMCQLGWLQSKRLGLQTLFLVSICFLAGLNLRFGRKFMARCLSCMSSVDDHSCCTSYMGRAISSDDCACYIPVDMDTVTTVFYRLPSGASYVDTALLC